LPASGELRFDSVILKLSLANDDIHRSALEGSRVRSHRDRRSKAMGRKLYVGNLPYSIGETELEELFSQAGTVESVTVMRDQATGRARGFAFVEMSTDEGAQTAINTLHETQLGGRNLTVNEARPKAARSGGGGGGFGGGGGSRRREPRW